LNLQEAANTLGVSKKKLWRAVRSGQVKAIKTEIGDKWEYQISEADLAQWDQSYFNTHNDNGFVYFLWSEHGIKIGRTTQPSKRLAQFGVKLPFETLVLNIVPVTCSVSAERYFHEVFASKRLNGEWFKITRDEILTALDSIQWDKYNWRYRDISGDNEAILVHELIKNQHCPNTWIEQEQEMVATKISEPVKATRREESLTKAKHLYRQLLRVQETYSDLTLYFNGSSTKDLPDGWKAMIEPIIGALEAKILRYLTDGLGWATDSCRDAKTEQSEDMWPSHITVSEIIKGEQERCSMRPRLSLEDLPI
jgi:hypothetical protein